MEFEAYKAHFEPPSDLQYLEAHYKRYVETRRLAYEHWAWESATILDIGAHWLHQALLYALDGHHVIAADFETTLNEITVQKLASEHNVQRLIFETLDSSKVFDELDESSVDVVLFCEILEHITFNPKSMWRSIHRVLKPGGRIIVTTPNHYAIAPLLRSIPRYLSGGGSGISVSDILEQPTHHPHWKEFSKREVRRYFESLSPDFVVSSIHYHSFRPPMRNPNRLLEGLRQIMEWLPQFKNGIYAQVELKSKTHGI